MAEKKTLSILETIKKKMQKLDQKSEANTANSAIGEEFEYLPSSKKQTTESASQEVLKQEAVEKSETAKFEDDLGLEDSERVSATLPIVSEVLAAPEVAPEKKSEVFVQSDVESFEDEEEMHEESAVPAKNEVLENELKLPEDGLNIPLGNELAIPEHNLDLPQDNELELPAEDIANEMAKEIEPTISEKAAPEESKSDLNLEISYQEIDEEDDLNSDIFAEENKTMSSEVLNIVPAEEAIKASENELKNISENSLEKIAEASVLLDEKKLPEEELFEENSMIDPEILPVPEVKSEAISSDLDFSDLEVDEEEQEDEDHDLDIDETPKVEANSFVEPYQAPDQKDDIDLEFEKEMMGFKPADLGFVPPVQNSYQTNFKKSVQGSATISSISSKTVAQTNESFKKLFEAQKSVSGAVDNFKQNQDFHESTTKLLETKLTKWLDENLPQMVEKIIREEIQKIVPKG